MLECLAKYPLEEALAELLKFSIEEFRACDFNLAEEIGELIVLKKEISFRDMQSIRRAFKTFGGGLILKEIKILIRVSLAKLVVT